MNYLLINTANEELVIVVYKNGEIFSCNEKLVKKHNEILLPKLDEVLKTAQIKLQDIDEFGVVIGPGSFTGIRVGIATIKAFRDVFNKPVRSINNLKLLYNIAIQQGIKCSAVAIEGSLNSYFVGKVNNSVDIYERNLSKDELLQIAEGGKIAFYTIHYDIENAVCVDFDNKAFVQTFLESKSNDLTPIYYQLSQAEHDKITHAKFIIREAEVWDIKAISLLDKDNFDNSWNEQMLEKTFINKNSLIYVAEIDENLAGFIIAENDVDEFNIARIVVDKNYRNHGIATRLIEMVENKAKENKENVSLEVNVNNFTAKTLYEKLGYSIRRVRKNYYKDGSDCLEMVKVFN